MSTDKRLSDIFIELTSIDGVSANERAVADYIKDFLRKYNFSFHEDNAHETTGGSTGNLICKYGSGGKMLLLSHMDTVSSTKNLKHRILEDRITTDGTTILGSDDRAGITTILYAIEKMSQSGEKLKDFTIVFTVDEERNLSGSKYLEPPRNTEFGIIFDSHSRPGNYIYQTYGAMEFNVRIIGKSAHAGVAPEKGVNSIKIAADAVSGMELGRIADDTTANIGKIQGGTAMNMVPAETKLQGEVRSLIPEKVEKTVESFKDKFYDAGRKHGGEIEFSSKWAFKPYHISQEMEIRKLIERTLRNVGLTPNPVITAGGSDANNLNAKGIPAVNIGIGAQNPHSVDEFILIEDLAKVAEIVMELIKNNRSCS